MRKKRSPRSCSTSERAVMARRTRGHAVAIVFAAMIDHDEFAVPDDPGQEFAGQPHKCNK